MSTRAYRDVESKSKEVSSASEPSAECLKDTEARFLRVEQEKLVSKEENKGNMRALARQNCHPELDSGSYQRYSRELNACKIPGQARNDRIEITRACGFTMAEILLSLTIIGVVAAITLPSLTGNINERTWNTQRKALYARFSQAIALMPALNGYGTLSETESGSITADTAAETFITDGLAKVLKINNICDSDHLEDCGIPDKITPYDGSIISPFPKTLKDYNSRLVADSFNDGYEDYSYSQINTKAAAFETANGESIAVYYNPACISDLKSGDAWDPSQARMCANFMYDLNGTKGPNTMGKDIGFMTAFYPTDSVLVAPYPYVRDAGTAPQAAASGTKTASQVCTSLDGGEWRLPTIDEAAAIYVNLRLVGNLSTTNHYWTTGVVVENGATKGVAMSMYSGAKLLKPDRSQDNYVRCIKR